MKKELLYQILWVIFIIGVIWFISSGSRNEPRQSVQPALREKTVSSIEKLCMDAAIQEGNEVEKFIVSGDAAKYLDGPNPSKEQIQRMKQGIQEMEFQECMDIWEY